MTQYAEGQFEVKATREPPYDDRDGLLLARTRFDKTFSGGLQGTSVVTMLSAGNAASPGNAGYVAMERVDATLDGRHGAFVLQHSGTMTHGNGVLSCTVVPGSGIGGLAGLSGALAIRIEDGQHFYRLDYALDDATPN